MSEQDSIRFEQIAQAIKYINKHFRKQPSLQEIAKQVNLSPFHFQRLFTEWAGISPKKFLQFVSIEHARQLLKENEATITDAAFSTGLSGTGRLHDLFVHIEAMTPGEYKKGGAGLVICFSFEYTLFGKVMVASTSRGICRMVFSDDENESLEELKDIFPNAEIRQGNSEIHQRALALFQQDHIRPDEIRLHLRGTDFQLRVWEMLLKIPMGGLTTYGQIAGQINNPKACRAVGSAVGDNPVSLIIPCHRVIQSTGVIGNYHWGSYRKTALIGWEAAMAENKDL